MKEAVASRGSLKRSRVRPRVKFWLELDGGRAFCPGVCRILEEVDRTGSLKSAAAAVDRSYRFVWGKVRSVEKALGCRVVETRVGGTQEQRSTLTPAGRTLLREFQTLRTRLFQLGDDELAPRLRAALGK